MYRQDHPFTEVVYCPSAIEIKIKCKEIQATWTHREEMNRLGVHDIGDRQSNIKTIRIAGYRRYGIALHQPILQTKRKAD
jgi:hypothetical protein|tara:strand:+ start:130 stop:369 length:240 start_codon:yes stop_codon:yes gene_type:complete